MIHVKIVTPEGLYKEMDTSILNIVSTLGERGILSNHVPVVLTLAISRMSTIENGVRKEYALAGGMLYYQNNEATVLTDAAEAQEDIDLLRAEEAKERALKRIKSDDSSVDKKRAEIALKKAENRIHFKS